MEMVGRPDVPEDVKRFIVGLSRERSALLHPPAVEGDLGTGKRGGRNRGPRMHTFDSRIRQLEAFAATHGHCRVTDKSAPGGDRLLADWARKMRKECLKVAENDEAGLALLPPTLTEKQQVHCTQAMNTLTRERYEQFKALGFVEWGRMVKSVQPWEVSFQKLVAFKEEHGHCNVPKRPPSHLGSFVQHQRKLFRGTAANGKLTPEQREKLISIGFCPQLKETVSWEDRIEECVLFKRVHGHLNVPPLSLRDRRDRTGTGAVSLLTDREVSFRTWAGRMRSDYAKVKRGGRGRGGFDAKRIKQLEQLGFLFTPPPRGAADGGAAAAEGRSPARRTAGEKRKAKDDADGDEDDDDDDDDDDNGNTDSTNDEDQEEEEDDDDDDDVDDEKNGEDEDDEIVQEIGDDPELASHYNRYNATGYM